MKKNINNFEYKKVKCGILGVVIPFFLCLTCKNGESHCGDWFERYPKCINSGIRTN